MKLMDFFGTESFNSMATQHSKASIFVFILTFLYMSFMSEISSGILGGALFFLFGIFVVSLVIALPTVMIKLLVVTKITKTKPLSKVTSGLMDFAYLLITILLTRYAYTTLFS